MNDEIIIIGAGVSGITTALALQLLGYQTKIYTEKQFSDSSDVPTFASLYPAASVIPHAVYSDHVESIFNDSQPVFYELQKQAFPGLSVHKHFEIFEFEKEHPKYLQWMRNFKMIERDEHFPQRPDADVLYGWSFDCIFADWPVYFPALVELYLKNGGKIVIKKVEPEDIATLPASVIVNCSGLGSVSLFDDRDKQLLMRGHLLHRKSAPLIKNGSDKVISYNYTPITSIYADLEGEPCDVYCYPRQGGWILGGSRQKGSISKDGQWQANEVESTLYELDGISFPSQIIDLNRQIIEHTFGLSFGDLKDLSPAIAYRFIRSENNGLRLDSEITSGKKVYHNYGHGGAGVTLSWGCALQVAAEIDGHESGELKERLLSGL